MTTDSKRAEAPSVLSEDVVERAIEFLAAAHEQAKKPLVALDLRTGNLGKMGVRWVETSTALAALRASLQTASLPTPAETQGDEDADSGMSGDAVARAEWAWANLPTGNRPWTSLATHEKALVCHTLARLATPPIAEMEEVTEAMIEQLRNGEDSYYDRVQGIHYFSERNLLTAMRSAALRGLKIEPADQIIGFDTAGEAIYGQPQAADEAVAKEKE